MKQAYDPENPHHRLDLAISLISSLDLLGFKRDRKMEFGPANRAEHVYSKEINNGLYVVVYTSCSMHKGYLSTRAKGNDAIRVSTVYVSPDPRRFTVSKKGIGKQKRVHRTGKISDICDRVTKRIFKASISCLKGGSCNRCGAPTFLSKAGNNVCAEICWTR